LNAPPEIKVLHVSYSLKTGGLERVILDLVRLGGRNGLTSAVAALGEAGELAGQVEEAGAAFFFLGKRPGLDWRMVPRLRALARRLGVHIIHAHNEGAGFYAGLAGLCKGPPVITTRHGFSYGLNTLWVRRAAGLLSRRTVCVGRDVMRLVREVDKIPASRVRIIYNGVDTAEFAPDQKRRELMRAELGYAPGDRILISVGRLAPEKGYDTLLRALALLAQADKGTRLVLVGDGPRRGFLQDLTKELGLQDRVRLLGNRKDIRDLLAAADVFVLSSLSEGVSKSLLEAMAMALPVVATSVGSTPEVVLAEKTGLLVPARRPDLLAQALAAVLHDSQSARWGRAGRERVEAEFSLPATVAAYARLYREVLGRND